MKPKIIGYMVINGDGHELALEHYSDGLLLRGPFATVFPNRRAANLAIDRTKAYADSKGYRWASDYRVVPLRGVE